MQTASGPQNGNRLVFPYRIVLQHEDGSCETMDPVLPGLPLEIGDSLFLTDGEKGIVEKNLIRMFEPNLVSDSSQETPGSWIVERIEEGDSVITESAFELNPAFRCGTAYCRPAKSK